MDESNGKVISIGAINQVRRSCKGNINSFSELEEHRLDKKKAFFPGIEMVIILQKDTKMTVVTCI